MSLSDQLYEFYSEVLRLRARVSEGRFVFAGDDASVAESPRSVLRKLTEILERQERDAKRQGGDIGLRTYKLAQFAMAALADEIFLTFDWPGREMWRDELLEAKLFDSQQAGELLFERIEEILRGRDENAVELGRIYLTVLALGFQGKYRDAEGADHLLDSFRRRLFRFIHQREPLATRGDQLVMPQAYESTASDSQRSKQLPYLRPWILGLVLLFAVWIGSSYAVYRYETSELVPLIDELAATKSTAHGDGQ
jgi:type VI secretion system protein ImpK